MLIFHLVVAFVTLPAITQANFQTSTILAGNGLDGNTGDGGPATSASLGHPSSVWVDSTGNFYIADAKYNVIRKVIASSPFTISTYAGAATGIGYQGVAAEENKQATLANLLNPRGVWGNTAYLFIADSGNYRVRQVELATGIISTLVGNGVEGNSATELFNPYAGYYDTVNNINYVGDYHGCVIRTITGSAGSAVLTTVAGEFRQCNSITHAGEAALQTTIGKVSSLTGDTNGNIYFTEGNAGGGINELVHSTQTITNVAAGTPSGYTAFGVVEFGSIYATKDGTLGLVGTATTTTLNPTASAPKQMFVPSASSIGGYIADAKQHKVYSVGYFPCTIM